MLALSDHDLPSLQALFAGWGANPVHAAPVLREYWRSGGRLLAGSLPIGRALAARLSADVPLLRSTILRRVRSRDGTVKLLVGFPDGAAVESVLMPGYRPGMAAGCLSSQVGCAMACDFCASGRAGFERNLTPGEIVEQFLHLRHEAAASARALRTIVFMGMGEPLHNLDAVVAASRRIADRETGALGRRRITISTVGIVPGIDALAEADLNVHLALSLHAPDDETRARLVPMNRAYPVEAILAAARRYQERSRRIVNLEYCLLAGVNDSDRHADLLAERLRGFRAHVNLIPYNEVGPGRTGSGYGRPAPERVDAFLGRLRAAGVVAHPRDRRGADIDAACGQLRETHRASAAIGGTPAPPPDRGAASSLPLAPTASGM